MDEYSGIISLFIACIELLLLINVLAFAEKNEVNNAAIRIILLLLLYQLSEFIICFAGIEKQTIIYAAFSVITLLPPLGLYLVLKFHDMDFRYSWVIYLPALFFIFYYPLRLGEFFVTKCTVLYAVYNYPLGFWYGVVYYLPILASLIILGIKHLGTNNKIQKKLSLSLVLGFYLTFIPAFAAGLLYESYQSAIESLMCKQAVILALALTYFAITNKTKKEIEQQGNNN